MIPIPIWLLVLLIATNFFVIMCALILVYLIAGIHDILYKPKKNKNNCPEKVEREDNDK